ncbi:MAG: DUF3990 domain-containing protein [Paludibacteraceae bacterium]|nr:DUF3990 domain-containing protein [Paludibacteraceae bacterium]
MLKLYHGSDVLIEKIDLTQGRINKDFGQGFYLTTLLEQAKEMAKRRARQSIGAQSVVTTFLFDDSCLNSGDLNVKIFPQVSAEWAQFILNNRHATRNGYKHDYDIVIGPIADDGVVQQLDLYELGMITMEQLVTSLHYRELNNQYYFGTERSIQYLQRV